MNRAIRFGATLLLCSIATIAILHVTIRPYSINRQKKVIQKETEAAYRIGDASAFAPAARANVEKLKRWLELTPQDIDLYMLLGANLRLLERPTEAVDAYRSALVWDRRPEIYFNLGMSQIESGDRERGLDNLAIAIGFSPDYLYLIVDPSLRTEAELHARQRHAN